MSEHFIFYHKTFLILFFFDASLSKILPNYCIPLYLLVLMLKTIFKSCSLFNFYYQISQLSLRIHLLSINRKVFFVTHDFLSTFFCNFIASHLKPNQGTNNQGFIFCRNILTLIRMTVHEILGTMGIKHEPYHHW